MTQHVLTRQDSTETDHESDTVSGGGTPETDLLPPEVGRGIDICPHCHTSIDGPEDVSLKPVSSTGSMHGLYCNDCDQLLFVVPEDKLPDKTTQSSATKTATGDD